MSLFYQDNKMKPHESLLARAVTSFMVDKFNIDSHISIRKSTRNNLIGDVSLSTASVNRNRFHLHLNTNQSFPFQIRSMIHELTHIKQISKGELKPTKEWDGIIWKNNKPLSVKVYRKIMKNDLEAYRKLPWEIEAEHNMNTLYKEFLQSSHFKNLKGKNINLDFIINSLTEKNTIIKLFEEFSNIHSESI